VLAAPAVSCANSAQENAHTSIQVQSEQSGIPCAMALRLIACSPRRTALLPPSSAGHLPPTWRQHRGARTTRLRRTLQPRSSIATSASTASHRTFVTTAKRPSSAVRRAELCVWFARQV